MTFVSLARRTALALVGVTIALAPTVAGCASSPVPIPDASSAPNTTPTPEGTVEPPSPMSTSALSGTPSADPQARRARFLDALREAGVPVSRSGDSEVLIAEGICQRLALGVSESDLVKDVEAMGPVWTPENALAVVRSAGTNYCTA